MTRLVSNHYGTSDILYLASNHSFTLLDLYLETDQTVFLLYLIQGLHKTKQ